MDRGKRSAIQAQDFLECFISATIGTANTFRCGPWPCTGICGRAGRCGPTKFGSTSLRPGVIETFVEQPAGVIRWRGATPLKICGESHRHLCRDSLGGPGRSAWPRNGSCCDNRRSALPYWTARGSHLLAHPNRRRSHCCRHCCGKDIKSTDHVVSDVHGVCLRARTGSGRRSSRRHSGVLCAW